MNSLKGWLTKPNCSCSGGALLGLSPRLYNCKTLQPYAIVVVQSSAYVIVVLQSQSIFPCPAGLMLSVFSFGAIWAFGVLDAGLSS